MVPPVPPPESDEDRRKRELRRREEEDRREAEEKKKKGLVDAVETDPVERLLEMMERVEPMLPQLDNLYSFYIKGFEKRPPLERRKQLDNLMRTMEMMPKPNSTLNFKFSALYQSYQSHRERWDRMLRDVESGKIKRPIRS